MLFYSYFKTLVGKEVTVELKNDLAITGVLHSVDQYLNIKLTSTRVVDEAKHPHMLSVRNCFVRGSVVRYVHVSVGSAFRGAEGGAGGEEMAAPCRASSLRPAAACGCNGSRSCRNARPDSQPLLLRACRPSAPPAARLTQRSHLRPSFSPPRTSHSQHTSTTTQLPPGSVDVEILHDATRREAKGG